MTPAAHQHDPHPSRTRPRVAEHAVAAVLLVLVLLMAGLVVQSTLAERARRETGAEAMRQFAGIAAWRYANGVEERLHDIAQEIAIPLSGYERRRGASLPAPDVLLPLASYSSRDHVIESARFAFRVSLADESLAAVGVNPTAGMAKLLTERLPRAARLGTPDTHRSLIDTADGRTWGVVYRIVRDTARQPAALYGWVVDGSALTYELASTARTAELLPTALAGPRPQDGMVAVRVDRQDGLPLFAHGDVDASPYLATDTVNADQGGYVITLSLTPALESRVLLGSPALPQWWTITLLVIGVLLAALAIHQLHRGRELARLREGFVASVSHELRTPLAQVSLFAETLMHGRERSSEERRYFAEVIYREAGRLTNLVDGILRFSRGGTQSTPEVRAADVSLLLRQVVEQFAPMAHANAADIELHAAPGTFALVDDGSLRQIMLNLLDNAVKYGPRGQTISIRVSRVSEGVSIAVADDGPGIPPADRERVFEPFTRLSLPGAPGTTGTGIGLAVVRELATAMGGSARVAEPEAGRGAVVMIQLGATDAPPAVTAETRDAWTGVVT